MQHYLGNVFKNAELEKIYKKYQLERCVRYGENFDLTKHRHIFVYALLGFVYEYAEEREILRFIYSNFLATTEHLIPSKQQNKDQWAKCVYLAKMYYNDIPVLQINGENDKHTCSVIVDNKTIAMHESKSIRYARKKAIKIALLYIAEQQAKLWADNPIAQEVEQKLKRIKAEKEAREKAERIKKYKEKQRERSEATRARKKARIEKAQQQDMQRRKAKAEAKKRKELQAEALRKKQLAMANMSVAKRRHLQDKGVLKKGAPSK